MGIYYSPCSKPFRHHWPKSLRTLGFNPKKAPAIIHPDIDTMLEAGDSELDSDQEPTRNSSP